MFTPYKFCMMLFEDHTIFRQKYILFTRKVDLKQVQLIFELLKLVLKKLGRPQIPAHDDS